MLPPCCFADAMPISLRHYASAADYYF